MPSTFDLVVNLVGNTNQFQQSMKRARSAGTQATGQLSQAVRTAAADLERIRTPAEIYTRKILDYNRAVAAGALNQGDFNRLIRQAKQVMHEQEMALEKTADAVERTTAAKTKLKPVLHATTRGSRTAGLVALEAARGFEDFTSQLGTQGLAGGLRGATNNLTQIMAILGGGGLVGAIGVVGVSLGTILIPRLLEASEASNKVVESLKNQVDFINKLNEAVQQQRGFRGTIGEFQGAGTQAATTGDVEAAQKNLRAFQSEIGQRAGRIAGLQKIFDQRSAEITKKQGNLPGFDAEEARENLFPIQRDLIKQQAELNRLKSIERDLERDILSAAETRRAEAKKQALGEKLLGGVDAAGSFLDRALGVVGQGADIAGKLNQKRLDQEAERIRAQAKVPDPDPLGRTDFRVKSANQSQTTLGDQIARSISGSREDSQKILEQQLEKQREQAEATAEMTILLRDLKEGLVGNLIESFLD